MVEHLLQSLTATTVMSQMTLAFKVTSPLHILYSKTVELKQKVLYRSHFVGVYTRENGFMGYNEVCMLLANRTSGWKRLWWDDMSQAVARRKDAEKDETHVVVFDSSRSIANKMKFAMSRELGGAMIWSVDTDDFLGDCDIDEDTFTDFKSRAGITLDIPKRYNANYPLLRTVNEAIVIAQSQIAQEAELAEKDSENEIAHGDGKGTGNRMYVDAGVAASAILIFFTKFML